MSSFALVKIVIMQIVLVIILNKIHVNVLNQENREGEIYGGMEKSFRAS